MTGKRGRGSLSPQVVERTEVEVRALALRRDGRTFEQIAVELGLANRGVAHKIVRRALSRRFEELDIDEVRALELERTELIVQGLLPAATGSCPDPVAVNALMRVLDFRAKLMGLFAPRRELVGIEIRSDAPAQRRLDAVRRLRERPDIIEVVEAHIASLEEACDESL